MSGGTRRAAVWALAALCSLAPAVADGNIGCLFSATVCADKVEWCYDDFAFGRCIPIYEDEPEKDSLYRYNMSSTELQSFEAVLQDLLSLGYRWRHAYTQCVLQAMLLSSRQNMKTVNMKLCDQFSDPDIVSEDRATEDDEEVDPEEVAYVRFTPNSPASDSDFANEVYTPPVDFELLDPGPRHALEELSYGGDDVADEEPISEVSERLLRKGNPDPDALDTFGRQAIEDNFDEPIDYSADGMPDIVKVKKSYPVEEDDEHDIGRMLANARKLDIDAPPYTTEYLTSNRFSAEEARVLSNAVEQYRKQFYLKEFPFEYEEKNDIPESRVYADEDDPDEDVGSGEFDPYGLQIKDGDLTEAQKSNIQYLLALWKSDLMRNKARALYAEGGPIIERTTGDIETPLSDADLQGILSDYDWGFKRRERLDVKKPGPRLDWKALMFKYKKNLTESPPPHTTPVKKDSNEASHVSYDNSIAYIKFVDPYTTTWKRGESIINKTAELSGLRPKVDVVTSSIGVGEVSFKVENNSKNLTATDIALGIVTIKDKLREEFGITVLSSGLGDVHKSDPLVSLGWFNHDNIVVVLVASGVVVVIASVALAMLIRKDAQARRKLAGLASAAEIDAEATQDYQDLCRARMTGKWSGQQTGVASGAVCGGDAPRLASLSREPDAPSQRSSTSSWSEEPALTNMDISTGHMVLAYMEDHLKNKDRLEQEWAALCAYEAEPCATTAASADDNIKKNRYHDVLPYDHSRVTLNTLTNQSGSDYVNASTITDHDPRNPAYIAAQGPLPHTAADFWQLVWEQGSVVMVMLTRLTENGNNMCHRYWPEEASETYHIYEVHLVSEHIWCDDYLVRSFYLKNLRTGETRTVTQFHFLSWPDAGVPASTKALLEFRRKVNKSYRGRSCPIVVHCSDGASRTGTYCLIDMVLNRMAKGAKEIDIAATLEHIRDQRPSTVSTKQQFEFVLMAVAEEVHAILKALPAQLQQQSDKNKEASDKDKAN